MCEALLLKRFSEIPLADLAADFARRHAAARHQRRLRFAGLFTVTRTTPASALAEAIGCACILVLGTGGGLELKAFFEMQPDWHFDGIDSSAEMLDLATRRWARWCLVPVCMKAISTLHPRGRSTARLAC